MRLSFRKIMLLTGVVLAGCARPDDPRLQGAWKSDRDATVAAAFKKDPRWTNASPEHIANFKNLFGRMVLTYSNNSVRMQMPAYSMASASNRIEMPAEDSLIHYHVVGRGSDFVVICPEDGFEKGQKIRIRFVDEGKGYWTETLFGTGPEEKFDKITDSALP